MTEKQKKFMSAHGLIEKLRNIGLNPDTLSTAQASDVIAKFYADQKAAEEYEKNKIEQDRYLMKELGQIPDYDSYPGCGYDRSWVG